MRPCLQTVAFTATIVAAAWASNLPVRAAESPGLMTSEFIYETASFPSCHASTIEQTPAGLVAAWFGGTDEGNRDVGIWFSRRDASQGRDGKWSDPVEVANGVESPEKRYPCWNPVLFQAPQGPLLLF